MFNSWVKIANENVDPRDIERLADMGQIEEMILMAEEELSLIPIMRENKPWDVPADHKIPITIRYGSPRGLVLLGFLTGPP